jgi:hypothetical protein
VGHARPKTAGPGAVNQNELTKVFGMNWNWAAWKKMDFVDADLELNQIDSNISNPKF